MHDQADQDVLVLWTQLRNQRRQRSESDVVDGRVGGCVDEAIIAVAWLGSSSPRPIWLTTMPGTRADRFYRLLGWQEAGPAEYGQIRMELTPAAC